MSQCDEIDNKMEEDAIAIEMNKPPEYIDINNGDHCTTIGPSQPDNKPAEGNASNNLEQLGDFKAENANITCVDTIKDESIQNRERQLPFVEVLTDDVLKREAVEISENFCSEDSLPRHNEALGNGHKSIYSPSHSLVELSRLSWKNEYDKQYYTRGCLWSPDGTCILSAVNLDGMHVIEVPADLFNCTNVNSSRSLDVLHSSVHVKEGGTVYDYCWYPFMNSELPETCCWIASRQHEPIQLWDAYNGDLRATYRGYNNVDEIQSAYAVCFTPDGEQILAGYKRTIKIFNTKLPGRDYTELSIKDPCSCIAVHSAHGDVFVTGSWYRTIHLYDLRSLKLGCLTTLEGHSGGVTYIKFSHNGEMLFTGARKDNKLLQWDMRNFAKPLQTFVRNVETNQRIYFDISNDGHWLTSGNTNGLVHFWNIDHKISSKEYQFPLHRDCCNGVGFHQTMPILCTTAGQYHFIEEETPKSETEKMYENSLIFWWFGKCETQ